MDAPHRTPTATYRFQLRREAPLGSARHALPYLRLLGISDLYLSPVYAARPGSIERERDLSNTSVGAPRPCRWMRVQSLFRLTPRRPEPAGSRRPGRRWHGQ